MACARGCCETQAEHYRGISIVSRSSLTKPVVREGRTHPDSGTPWKRTEDEGSIITEHNTKNDRVDAIAKATPIVANLADLKQRKAKAGGN